MFKRILSLNVIVCFFLTTLSPLPKAHAAEVSGLPAPGTMLTTTPTYAPAVIEGIIIDPANPLKMDFIIDTKHTNLQGDALSRESMKLIKYFLSSLTIPENEVWVNLSPYEKNRIIEQNFAKTEMGKDMLAQDYILKQLSASLTYPEKGLGNKFWQRVYSQVMGQFGTEQIPMSTFNKIWIVPQKAVVFQKGNSAYVIDSHLKVMLEEDYLALKKNLENPSFGMNHEQEKAGVINSVSSQVVRDILIPVIEKEVNEGANFANLRQIYNSMILATWYKKNLKETLLGQIYVNQNKTKGIDGNKPSDNQQIYNQYLAAFKKGVYNYIKEDYDVQSQTVIPRKYFSGGTDFAQLTQKLQQVTVGNLNELTAEQLANLQRVELITGGKFRVTLGLIENATTDALQKAVISPSTTVLAQRITAVRGARTGEIFIEDAIAAGANGMIGGHSETIGNLSDSDSEINEQIKAGHKFGLKTIILAVGESSQERDQGIAESTVAAQLKNRLQGLTPEQVADTKIAYEPRWAIQGPNFVREAKPEDAQNMAAFIRNTIAGLYSPETAQKVRIIYGGSVNKTNAKSYLELADIDGALPGSSSTSVVELEGIVNVAIEVGPKNGRVPLIAGNWKTYGLKNTPEEFANFYSQLDASKVETAVAPSTTTQIKTMAAALISREVAKARATINDANKPTIHFGFKRPEGQPKDFFTNIYSIYSLNDLLNGKLEVVPDEVVNAIRAKLDQDIKEGKILSARVNDFGGDSIDIHVTHNFGELNADVHRLLLVAMRAGLVKAKEMGLLKADILPQEMPIRDLINTLNEANNEHSISERGAESVGIARLVGATPGAANIKLFHEFGMPGSTPLQKLGLSKSPGFRFRVRKVKDFMNGIINDQEEMEFEISHERKVMVDGKEVILPGRNDAIPLLGLLSQPNDYQLTGVYPVEGGALNPNEPIASVVYQMANTNGHSKLTNTAIIYRSQSGADAVGGIASIVYDANFVPGGENGDHFVATMPVVQEQARHAPKEGIAYASYVGYQSRHNGEIPMEAIVDHVGINPPAVSAQVDAARKLAEVMTTHKDDQPYLSPGAAEEQMVDIRDAQDRFYQSAPRDNEHDPMMDEVEAKIKAGKLIVTTHEKADMGGTWGHTQVPPFMRAVYEASLKEAVEQGILTTGSTLDVGDDGHMLMVGDKSDHGDAGHQLAFLAFTRAFLMSNKNGLKVYGEAQDYQGPEAKAAKKNPYFYSKLTERFFELLKVEMAKAYPKHPKFATRIVDTVYNGWQNYLKTGKSDIQLTEKPFSGNVSQQGIGYARYMVDKEHGETSFSVLAGDKMGPQAFNRVFKNAVFNAVDDTNTPFPNGLVFEIWDAKAFDRNGNIRVRDIPLEIGDVKDLGIAKLSEADQQFLRGSYDANGILRNDLSEENKLKLIGLLKEAGFLPTKRIFLDAKADREAIIRYLADSDRFNIKHVWAKKKDGWDIAHPEEYLDRPMVGSSITRLGILADGAYVGKDDPVAVGHNDLFRYIFEFLRDNPLIIQGDMNGSHWLEAIATAVKYGVATTDSHPILLGIINTLAPDGKSIVNTEDIFGKPEYDDTRKRAFDFNWRFKKAQLGGQWEPYGTNVRTVEAAYELANLLRELTRSDSPYRVSNKKKIGEIRVWPHVAADSNAALYRAIETGRADAAMNAEDAASEANAEKIEKMNATTHVGINGIFGEIGRGYIMAELQSPDNNVIVAGNDPVLGTGKPTEENIRKQINLLQMDFNILPGSQLKGVKVGYETDGTNYWMTLTGPNGKLLNKGVKIRLTSFKNPEEIAWSQVDAKTVIDATGVFVEEDAAARHIKSGAKVVIISAPGKGGNIRSFTPGANGTVKEFLRQDAPINDCASCTTNSISGVVGTLLKTVGIAKYQLTTVHAYTRQQSPLDDDFLIESSGVAKALPKIYPQLAGLGSALAVRGPVKNGSLTIFNFTPKNKTPKEEIQRILREAAEGPLKGIIRYQEGGEERSNAILGSEESGIVQGNRTEVIEDEKGEQLVTLFVWYDNAKSYPYRLVDLVTLLNMSGIGQHKLDSGIKLRERPPSIAAIVKEMQETFLRDAAMLNAVTTSIKPYGGIDLNSKFLDLQIRRDSSGIPLPLNQQPIYNMKIDGFSPYIIKITPMNTAPSLGQNEDSIGLDKLSLN